MNHEDYREEPAQCESISASLHVTPPTAKNSQVLAQMKNLNEAIMFLKENISKLETRLNQVLTTPEKIKQAEDASKAPMPILVPLARGLYQQKQDIIKANIKLSSILARLEL